MSKSGTGKIYLPDPANDPLLIYGGNTKFTQELKPRYTIILPNKAGTAEVESVVSDTELRLSKPFLGDAVVKVLTTCGPVAPPVGGNATGGGMKSVAPEPQLDFVVGCTFKLTPYVDQSELFDSVTKRLEKGECVGIFPEVCGDIIGIYGKIGL
jgi:glycerol-3-phosphate O-acyltransferase/dihydroxyacetone phosphate acyltransferase